MPGHPLVLRTASRTKATRDLPSRRSWGAVRRERTADRAVRARRFRNGNAMNIKNLVRSAFYRMGYDIRRRTSGFHADPFDDEKVLMRGRKVEVIFDLGANVGMTSLKYSRLFPGAAIYAFEPFEE